MAALPTVDSPDATATLADHLTQFDALIFQRGEDYASSRRVKKLDRVNDQRVRGEVQGTRVYFVDLVRSGEKWENRCTCPMEGHCKHAVAVGLLWLTHLNPEVLSGVHSQATAAARVPPERILGEKLGRALTKEENAFVAKLTALYQGYRQSGRVSPVELAKLGFKTSETQRPPYKAAYEGWWAEPPPDALALWQYIAHDIETSGLTVPEFMRPVTDTAGIREQLQNRERRDMVKRWNDRFSRLIAASAPVAASELSALLPPGTELRLVLGTKWTIETRGRPDGPWKTAPRNFLEQLAREPATAFLPLDLPPAVFAFLAMCSEHYARTFSLALNPGLPGGRELLHRLLFHRLARSLVVNATGEPLAFSAAPLAWRVEPAGHNAHDYEISLLLPDGRPLPPGALHLPGKPDLYLHDRTIFVGPPALDGTSATAAIVPSEVIHRPEVLRTLRRLGTKLPAELEARFVSVPLRARIACSLAIDFSRHEILLLQLHALAAEPEVEHVWNESGWHGLKNATPRAPKGGGPAPVYSLDFSLADTAAARLRELGLTYDLQHHAWARRVTKAFPEEFVAWREALPPEVEVLATGELASLLATPVRARIDLSLVESAAHRDWFDLALALKPEDSTLTPAEIALLLKARGKLVRLPGKGWRRLSVELEGAPVAALEAAGFDPDSLAEAALGGERHRFHALQLAQSTMTELLPRQQAEALRARARELAVPAPPALPAGLRAELRPYQREGFHFLAFLSANRLGGVLADDMGLGKTVQALAWLLWLAEARPAKTPLRALVVAPKSVVGNWVTEAARFAPSLHVERYAPGFAWDERRPGAQIVVANYTQLRLSADFFQRERWHAAILDEGQFIKTPSSKVAQIARELPGEHRLVLTGTPIENRLLDLWSLFAFALPGLLGPQAAFKRHYAQDNPLALTRLRLRVRHFLLRRTKAQVAADLPPRTEEDILLELEGDQAKLYQAELKRARAQLLRVQTDRQLDKARFNILASLMRLRQICCHPGLVDPSLRAAPSAKLDALLEHLEELRDEGHQVLVFSQFVEMLNLIRERLVAEKIDHLMLTGQTEDRDELVAQFQAEKKHTVFLLSLKAAGFGLNLTAASYVILYDPWWNPAVEAQAIDRTHRIGQSQPVNAYRLLARGTVEEKIRGLQREKSSLAGAIVQEESLASMLDLDSLRRILE